MKMTEQELFAWGRANLEAFHAAVAAIKVQDCKTTSGRRYVGNAYREIIQASHQHRIDAGLTLDQAKVAIARANAIEREEMVEKGWSGDTVSGWHLADSERGVTYSEAIREQRRIEQRASAAQAQL